MSSTLKVNLDAVRHNVRQIKDLVGPGIDLAAVIKADAYGLGAAGTARAMIEGGADLLAVARYGEAAELVGLLPELKSPILVMGLCSDQELTESPLKERIIFTIDSLHQAQILSQQENSARVHVKIDTGFSRLGLKASRKEAFEEYRSICSLPGIAIEGIFSHLCLKGSEADGRQFYLLTDFVKRAESEGLPTGKKHLCDSIGLARYPHYWMDMVRAGAILYGMRPFESPLIDKLQLDVTYRWTAPIIHITELAEGEEVGYDDSWKAPPGGARIATLPVGYADGYKRDLSNRGSVFLGGVKCPVIGLICMDQMMIDISKVPQVSIGDEAELLGEEIPIMELADKARTNRNDILASIGRRVRRIYRERGNETCRLDYMASTPFERMNDD